MNDLRFKASIALEIGLYPGLSFSEGDNPLFDNFYDDILSGTSVEVDKLKKELDFWFFWIDKFSPAGTEDQFGFFYDYAEKYDEQEEIDF